jgi:hypothetical protein
VGFEIGHAKPGAEGQSAVRSRQCVGIEGLAARGLAAAVDVIGSASDDRCFGNCRSGVRKPDRFALLAGIVLWLLRLGSRGLSGLLSGRLARSKIGLRRGGASHRSSKESALATDALRLSTTANITTSATCGDPKMRPLSRNRTRYTTAQHRTAFLVPLSGVAVIASIRFSNVAEPANFPLLTFRNFGVRYCERMD